jgi:hypothetical protein
MTDQLIIHQLQMMPENLKQEVLDFMGYLLSKHQTAISSQKEMPKIPVFGSAKGKYVLAPDFDAPLEDFEEYM